jgi:membrane protein DedA with SNARE-associated domain
MLSAAVTVPIVVTLGYKFGEHLDDIRRVIHKVQWGLAAAVLVGLAIYLSRRRRRRLQMREPRPPTPTAPAEIRESRS